MHFYKRKKVFYVSFFNETERKQKRISTGSTTKTGALQFIKNQQDTEAPSELEFITLIHFSESYLQFAKQSYSTKHVCGIDLAMRRLKNFLGDMYLYQVSSKDIDIFISSLANKSGHTAVAHYRTLKAAFNKAVNWEYIEKNPFDKIKIPKIPQKHPAFITREQLDTILTHTENQIFKLLFLTAFYTGMRKGEVVNLKWRNVNLDNAQIHICNTDDFTTKSKRERIIPLAHQLLELLKAHYVKSNSEYVFAKTNGFKFHPDYVSEKFRKSVLKTNLPRGIHFHSLRHSFASMLVQRGAPLYVIKELLGHSDIKTTQIYSHLRQDNLVEAVKLL